MPFHPASILEMYLISMTYFKENEKLPIRNKSAGKGTQGYIIHV